MNLQQRLERSRSNDRIDFSKYQSSGQDDRWLRLKVMRRFLLSRVGQLKMIGKVNGIVITSQTTPNTMLCMYGQNLQPDFKKLLKHYLMVTS